MNQGPVFTPCVRPKARESRSNPLLSESWHQYLSDQITQEHSNNPTHPITDHIIKFAQSHAQQILHSFNSGRNPKRYKRNAPFWIKPIHNCPKRYEQPDIIQYLHSVGCTTQKSSVRSKQSQVQFSNSIFPIHQRHVHDKNNVNRQQHLIQFPASESRSYC